MRNFSSQGNRIRIGVLSMNLFSKVTAIINVTNYLLEVTSAKAYVGAYLQMTMKLSKSAWIKSIEFTVYAMHWLCDEIIFKIL